METKIVYVVYGSRTEISNLIAFLVSGEWAFNYSGEYLYFPNDPTELIKEAGMDLKVVTENWCTNCFGFKDAPREFNHTVERSETVVKADTIIKTNNLTTASEYMAYFKTHGATEIRDSETRQKGGRKYLHKGKVSYLYQF
ncbi:hypothetical protein EEL34_14975 [Muribaculaceae bacterium Isolate-039 (Harlan)]|nr:hypothetical protein [Prevotella sp.]ROS80876.1 hypothetical protein EEL34_14975 [Muribaculaceae bacterium Isolate-039 (Harlan)]